MLLNEKWDDNTILYYIEDRDVDYDESVVNAIILSIGFYDCHYYVYLEKEDLESEFPSLSIDGDSKLFAAIEELLERDYWPKVKDAFARYQKWYEENN